MKNKVFNSLLCLLFCLSIVACNQNKVSDKNESRSNMADTVSVHSKDKDSINIDSIFYSQKSMGFRISNNMEKEDVNLPVDPIFEFKDGADWKEVKYKKSDVEYLDGLVLIYLPPNKTKDIFIPLQIYDIKSDTSILYRMTQKYSIGKENREPVYDKMLIKEFRLNQEMIDDLKK